SLRLSAAVVVLFLGTAPSQLYPLSLHDALPISLAAKVPDIVLSDLSMPGFSGYQALRILRELHPQLPFIFVSGTMGEDTAVQARSEEHTSELQSRENLVCRLPPEKKKTESRANI